MKCVRVFKGLTVFLDSDVHNSSPITVFLRVFLALHLENLSLLKLCDRFIAELYRSAARPDRLYVDCKGINDYFATLHFKSVCKTCSLLKILLVCIKWRLAATNDGLCFSQQ